MCQPNQSLQYDVPSPLLQQANHPRYRKRLCLLKVLLVGIIAFGVVTLLFWLAMRPANIKFYVVNANLREFNLTKGSTVILHYNLRLNMAVRNPNKKVTIYYDKLDAVASYEGGRFGWTTVAPFYQGSKNTSDLSATFEGQHVMVVGESWISKFVEEEKNRVFGIHVKFNTEIRFRMGELKTLHLRPDIDCHLRVPFGTNSTSTPEFESTRCHVDL